MPTNIPRADGVPGISGPPNWLTPPNVSFDLDDVRWQGATFRTFGGGASRSAGVRATQAVVGGQQFIYLSFRAMFAPALSDQFDSIYLGLQKTGGSKAMVIRLQAHPAAFTPAGPPSANPPANVANVQISTRTSPATAWTVEAMSPAWINTNTRVWLQPATAADPNNRWAVQVRVPVTAAADIVDASGPNLGTDFVMWYVIRGSVVIPPSAVPSPIILADYRLAGATTNDNLDDGAYPLPTDWDTFRLTSGPGTTGGVALFGNASPSEIVVQNSLGEGTTIVNGGSNTFVARPRNYTGVSIPAGAINATFRMANWGSVAGDPHQINWASGVWDYVPGNSATVPVASNAALPALTAGASPPTTNNQLSLNVPTLTLGANKSIHQCILVTLSGTNLNFLNDSAFRNMNFDHASLLEREAEISIVGLTPFSPQPRDVYLSLEKINMERTKPAGTNEGRFLEASMARLIQRGGPLAEKLQAAQRRLGEAGDYGSAAQLDRLLSTLRRSLLEIRYTDIEAGHARLNELIAALQHWLVAVKQQESDAPAQRLATLFDALADWLLASGLDAVGKLATFISRLTDWLGGLGNDPASSQLAPEVLRALEAWLSVVEGGEAVVALMERLQRWFASGRPPGELPGLLNALRDALASLSRNSNLTEPVAVFAQGAARWLRGFERLNTFVNILTDVDLSTEEIDQLFPTFRVHVYHDTGERVTGSDGQPHPVLRVQSSFGLYAYHEGGLEGWQTSIQGAQRIAENLYLIAVPNNGTAKITTRVQAVGPDETRIPDDPIVPPGSGPTPGGCLTQILNLFRRGKQ